VWGADPEEKKKEKKTPKGGATNPSANPQIFLNKSGTGAKNLEQLARERKANGHQDQEKTGLIVRPVREEAVRKGKETNKGFKKTQKNAKEV